MRRLVISASDNVRSSAVARALRSGARATNIQFFSTNAWTLKTPLMDAVYAFYGLKEHLRLWKLAKDQSRRFIFFDLGYWRRSEDPHDPGGHYRVSVDDIQPSLEHIATAPFDYDRLDGFPHPVTTRTRPRGHHALIIGMSPKAAKVFGYEPFEWEAQMAQRLQAMGLHPYYRAKPTMEGGINIPNAISLSPTIPVSQALDMADYVVAYHSNMALEACALDVPYYCEMGAAKALSAPSVEVLITHQTASPEARRALIAQAAGWQWSLAEVARGDMFKQLQSRGIF